MPDTNPKGDASNLQRYGIYACLIVLATAIISLASLYADYRRTVADIKSSEVIARSQDVIPSVDTVATSTQVAKASPKKIVPPASGQTTVVAEQSASIQNQNLTQEAKLELYVKETGYAKVMGTKVQPGATAYDLVKQLSSTGHISIKEKYFDGMGYFIQSINGFDEKPGEGVYWQYKINGQRAQVGISTYVLRPGDTIRFELSKEL